MTTVALAIPDDLHFHQGDEVELHARVQADGSFVVTHLVPRNTARPQETPASAVDSPMTLTGWARKWAGTMKLEEGETRESLRDSYMKEKFGE